MLFSSIVTRAESNQFYQGRAVKRGLREPLLRRWQCVHCRGCGEVGTGPRPDSDVSNLLTLHWAIYLERAIFVTFITQDMFWVRFPPCFKQFRSISQFQMFSAELCVSFNAYYQDEFCKVCSILLRNTISKQAELSLIVCTGPVRGCGLCLRLLFQLHLSVK